MFEGLTERLGRVIKSLKGQGRITESNIEEGVRAVRLALLEADVHVSVVKDLIKGVRARAMGQEVLQSLTPDQHFIKILKEEVERVLGEGDSRLKFGPVPPGVIMLAGLQGSGKTTTAGKLAGYFQHDGHPCLLVPADVYRPAARQQLETVGKSVGVPVYSPLDGRDPVEICRAALQEGKKRGIHRLIIDTAGRLHLDEALMEELEKIRGAVTPDEILYVADAMTGQSAVATAKAFHEKVPLTGVILTKADGDARGGALLSIKSVTGVPVKFVGVGEKLDALEPFHPDRMASRILGMGDVLTLIEKAQQTVDIDEAEQVAERLQKAQFTLEDFRGQLRQIRKMGPLHQVLGMIPGMGSMQNIDPSQIDEKRIKRLEAIMDSMTPYERTHPQVFNGSRRRRVAMGSGVSVTEVNQLLKQFQMMRKMMQKMKKGNMKNMMRALERFR